MTDDRIQRALELAQAGQRQAARDLIKDILAEDPDNLDALKAYLRVARNPQAARQIVNRILVLAPDDPWALGARDALDNLIAQGEGRQPRGARGRLSVAEKSIIGAAAAVVLLGVVALILLGTGVLGGSRRAATPVAVESPAATETEEPTAPATAVPTETLQPSPTRTPRPTATDRPTATATGATASAPTAATAGVTVTATAGTAAPTATPGGLDLGPGLVPVVPDQLVLFAGDMPSGFEQNINDHLPNEVVAGSADRLAQFAEWGRLDGWETGYVNVNWCDEQAGVIDVTSYVSVYQSADGAAANYQYNLSTSGWTQDGSVSLGDQAHAEYVVAADATVCGAPASITRYVVYFRWRNTYGSVAVSGLTDEQATLRSQAVSFATIVVQRIMGRAG
jgi:hypothetical protein